MRGAVSFENRAYLPNYGDFRVDIKTLLYTFGVAIVTGVLFGFAPAVRCWRAD
jgi:hypothetical protein